MRPCPSSVSDRQSFLTMAAFSSSSIVDSFVLRGWQIRPKGEESVEDDDDNNGGIYLDDLDDGI